MKRISMIGVVASTAGSLLVASTVILSASLAVANPADGKPGYDKDGPYASLPQMKDGLDLPVGVPVYDPKPQPPTSIVPPVKLDSRLPKSGPVNTTPPPADDPRDEPPPVFFGEEIDADTNSIIYVVDNSGSMTISVEPFTDETGAVVRGNRLDRAKAELRRSISSLPQSFYFNVIFYDECMMSCWPQKKRATADNKAAAFAWIGGVQPDGWTNTGLAVATALRDKENKSVVLLSDGSPNFLDCAMNYVGTFEQHRELIRNSNTQGAVINTFGIGLSADQDARSFMQAVAAENRGSYVQVD
jgi:hypothetical protein